MNDNIPIDKGYQKFFKMMDFFSITFQFRVTNKAKYSSFFGGVISLLYIIVIISYITKSFFDYISFDDFKIQFIERYNEELVLDFNQTNFFYSFRFTYINSSENSSKEHYVMDSPYKDLFEIENNYVIVDKNSETEKDKIPIDERNCSEVNMSYYQTLKKNHNGVMEQPLNLSDHICFDYPNMSLYGQYTDDKSSYIEVILKLNNESLNEENKNKTIEILKIMIFKFAPHYTDHIYDVSDLHEPITLRVESTVYSYVDVNYYERVNIFFKHLKFSQDKNLLYKKPDPKDYLKFSYYEKYNSPMFMRLDPKSNFSEKYNFVKYFIRPSMIENTVNVSLPKIPEFLSGISAIATNLLNVFNIIVSYFNNFQAKQKIITRIMKYNEVLKMNHQKEIDYLLSEMKSKKNNKGELTKLNATHSQANKMNLYHESKQYDMLIEKQTIPKIFEQNISQNPSDRTDSKFFSPYHKKNLRILEKQSNEIRNEGNNKILEKKKKWKEHLINFYYNCNNKESIELSNFKNLNNEKSTTILKNNLGNDNNQAKLENFSQSNQVLDIKEKQNELFVNESANKNVSIKDRNIKGLVKSTKKKKLINPLKITIRELIFGYLTCKKIRKKQNIFRNAEEKFNHNMDVLTFQRKMLEIDIIKFLILDKNLLEIMNFISKPSVSLEMDQKQYEEEIYEFFDSESAKNNQFCMYKIKDAYSELQRLESKNPYIQERILKLFKNQIHELKP